MVLLVLLFLALLSAGILAEAFGLMIFIGVLHHQVLSDIVPVSYEVSIQLVLALSLFQLVGGLIKGASNNK